MPEIRPRLSASHPGESLNSRFAPFARPKLLQYGRIAPIRHSPSLSKASLPFQVAC